MVVDGPVRPDTFVVHGPVGLGAGNNETVGRAAPVQVIVAVVLVLVTEVIKMSGTNAKLVMA